MIQQRILLGSFDLFHTGHLGQIVALAGPGVSLELGVLSDAGVREFFGAVPFMADTERAAVLRRVRDVNGVFVVGPETDWAVPEHDALYIDDSIATGFSRVRPDLHPTAATVRVTKLPSHPAVAGVLAALPRIVA